MKKSVLYRLFIVGGGIQVKEASTLYSVSCHLFKPLRADTLVSSFTHEDSSSVLYIIYMLILLSCDIKLSVFIAIGQVVHG
jgi:hypothetical protein